MEEFLQKLNALLAIAGNISLEDAITWVQVEENAEKLRREGHEEDTDTL